MAKSKAKRQRDKLSKRGKFNPESLRGSWGDINPIERKTKTKREKEIQNQKEEDKLLKQKHRL